MPKTSKPNNRKTLPNDAVYFTHPAQKARISMIATPIGNLSNVTDRARIAMSKVDELWCEDTRHTQALLNALGIERTKLKRVDQHIDEDALKKMLRTVEDWGQWIGVVTDAGTPGVSDPGAKITELLFQFPEIKLEPIPGVSAVSAFVSIAGITHTTFEFQGFFPRNRGDATQLLSDLKDAPSAKTLIFFESPNRITDTVDALKNICETLDFTPKFVFAKELTKIHESLWMGDGPHFLEWFRAQTFDERGEWVFSVTLPKNCVINKKDEANWMLTLECLIEAQISTKDAAQIISERFSVAKKLAYQSALDIQKKIKK